MSEIGEYRGKARRSVAAVAGRAKRRALRPIAVSIAAAVKDQLNQVDMATPRTERVAYPEIAYPALESGHVKDARLYATREDLVADLGIAPGGTVAELGVAFGDFSEFLLGSLSPSKFVALDIFKLHEIPVIWGKPSEEWFRGRSHREYYEERLARASEVELVIVEGDSASSLDEFRDQEFDLIYIDAGHEYADVARDAQIAAKKIRPDGFIVFNDYTMADHLTGSPYGIVQAVNSLVVDDGWHVVAFALQRDLFCDIAIAKGRR